MSDKKMGPSTVVCKECGGYKGINPPRPCKNLIHEVKPLLRRVSSDGWVKTSERMPEKRRVVLIFSPQDIEGENIHKMYYDPDSDSVEYGEWVSDCTPNRRVWFSFHEHEVSHWMELPEGPKD